MSLVIDSIADLPVGIKHGVGGLIDNKIYAGLGSAGKQFFLLDLNHPELSWQCAPEFPGVARDDAAYAVCDDKLYVFSGAGIEPNKMHPTVLLDSWVFDSSKNSWNQLEETLPIGLLGASCASLSSGEIVCFGGYRKETFDDFVEQLSHINIELEPEKHKQLLTQFMSQEIADYGWNQNILKFTPSDNLWSVIGENPFPANCGAGIAQSGNVITLVEGEIKPGLRSLQTKQYDCSGATSVKGIECSSIVSVDYEHEGLAGHFVGKVGQNIYVYGGAYFIGSWNNLKAGKLYTHQGLQKHFTNKVWKFDGESWCFAGEFGEGLAYGISLCSDQCMYIIGGENNLGEAQKRCYTLS
ncbi:N-acetylneuraminic acid mutarotase [Vibrio diazotrophicus]|jgi:N-acetylneuraminate epimerase|nr:N-acetylneuraminic acid mutarotase [Vibrio diazotrophicus]